MTMPYRPPAETPVTTLEGYDSGLATVPLAVPTAQRVSSPPRKQWLGYGLIGLGVLWSVVQMTGPQLEIEGGLVLLTIASCFLFWAFWKRIYALSIPGFILAGLSAGVTFADITSGVSVLWGLALGFAAIFLMGRTWNNVHHPWPLIPASVLFGVGCIVAASEVPAFLAAGFVWLPLAMIGLGLLLGSRNRHG